MWDQALEIRAVPADQDHGREGRFRVHGHRRAHRSQVAVAPRALDGCGRSRRGSCLAHGSPGSVGETRAARRARARPRSGRRLERDLGEAGTAWIREWERVRLHPHYTERAFAQSSALAPIGMLAAHITSGSTAPATTAAPRTALDQAARILAAADSYTAMREARAYRPASTRRRRRRSSCGRPRRDGSTRRRSTRCWPPPATAWRSDRASSRPA